MFTAYMSFRHNDFGRDVSQNPSEAARKLAELLVQCGLALKRTAIEAGVTRQTLHRWLRQLKTHGHDVKAMARAAAAKPE